MSGTGIVDHPGAPLVPPSAADAADAGALAAELRTLETLSRFDHDGIEARAQRAGAAAAELGLTELELRARLVEADLSRMRGNVAAAGRLAQDVHRWASDHDSRHLLARSSFVLAAIFQELGDASLALEHAVRAVDLLVEDSEPAMQIDHHTRLADTLGLAGDDAAQERYDQVLRLAEEIGDVDRQLVVLNNRAYSATVCGRFDAALAFSTQLQTLGAAHGVTLHVGRLDTVARALMGLGRLEEAEAVLLPGLAPEALDASGDGDAGADFLLTLAEVQRQRGSVPSAQATLDECVRRCDRYGLTSIRVRARREQAELHAAGGDFRAAFAEHKRYTQALVDLQSAQRDARARALHAMYETAEARQQSRRYRELSLRDPLTGLYNRRYVDEQLPRLLRRAAGSADEVTLALLDLDHFKRINDTCSHEIGDDVLRTVAQLLQVIESPQDLDREVGSFAARMGGEEFLLVLIGRDPSVAARQLDAIRQSVATHLWADLTGALPVTVSIGATSTARLSDPMPAELLSRADGHLYRAKREGRNRLIGDLIPPAA